MQLHRFSAGDEGDPASVIKIEEPASYDFYRSVINGHDVTAAERFLLARLYPEHARFAIRNLITGLKNILGCAVDLAENGQGPTPDVPRWQKEVNQLLDQLLVDVGNDSLPATLVEGLRSGAALDDMYGKCPRAGRMGG
ncbi:MAG: hypothetical protein P4L83_03600 [Nevskia sp.]|nr:hypothetical protein [Nevskia sp.]